MKSNLIIPSKINVGFQNRDDTYTKMLAYVIYFDAKGVLRKEKSWSSWRDKKIEPKQFDNTPTEGFVLNKGVGGTRESWGHNVRNEYVRIYDPRNFEFEISVPNLLFILQNCDCSRGKGLEGKFVYAWDKNNLVLLPENAEEYKSSVKYTELQTKSIHVKDLVPGYSYLTKDRDVITYLGRFTKHSANHYEHNTTIKGMYVFWNGSGFTFLKDNKKLGELKSDTVDPNYAELVDKYNKSVFGSKPKELFLVRNEQIDHQPKDYYQSEYWCIKFQDWFIQCAASGCRTNDGFRVCSCLQVNNGMLIHNQQGPNYVKIYDKPVPTIREVTQSRHYWDTKHQTERTLYTQLSKDELWVRLESGAEYKIGRDIEDPLIEGSK